MRLGTWRGASPVRRISQIGLSATRSEEDQQQCSLLNQGTAIAAILALLYPALIPPNGGRAANILSRIQHIRYLQRFPLPTGFLDM
jgi:hypothetical protein